MRRTLAVIALWVIPVVLTLLVLVTTRVPLQGHAASPPEDGTSAVLVSHAVARAPTLETRARSPTRSVSNRSVSTRVVSTNRRAIRVDAADDRDIDARVSASRVASVMAAIDRVPISIRFCLRVSGVRVVLHRGAPLDLRQNSDLRGLPRFDRRPGFYRIFGNVVYVRCDGELASARQELLRGLGHAFSVWAGDAHVSAAFRQSTLTSLKADERRELFCDLFAQRYAEDAVPATDAVNAFFANLESRARSLEGRVRSETVAAFPFR